MSSTESLSEEAEALFVVHYDESEEDLFEEGASGAKDAHPSNAGSSSPKQLENQTGTRGASAGPSSAITPTSNVHNKKRAMRTIAGRLGAPVTPLQAAAMNGHLPVVRTLLEAGADARWSTRDGFTARHFAQQTGHTEVAKLLSKYEGSYCSNPSCKSGNSSAQHLKKCGACNNVSYCSSECSKTHWRIHKPFCVSHSK